jgi:coenzyme F420 hydrogenase subunit beta
MSRPTNLDNVSAMGVLCTQCGACEVICPIERCISFSFDRLGNCYPVVSEEKCIRCRLCLQVCAAAEIELDKLHERVFAKRPDNPAIGHWVSSWVGYAANPVTRYEATSGGIVTALLEYALKQNIIDGALVVGLGENLIPAPFIARTAEDVIRAKGSKYLPVAPLAALSEIMHSREEQRIGVVGLPCQIEGLHRLLGASKKLARRIAFSIGLFCNHTKDRRYTDFLLQRLGQSRHTVTQIQYRGHGWPGEIWVTTQAGDTHCLPQQSHSVTFMWYAKAYASPRCLICADHLADFADIAVGDAWLPEYIESDDQGTSIIVCRTAKGQALLEEARSAGAIHLSTLPVDKVLQSQPDVLRRKRRSFWGGLAYHLANSYKEVEQITEKYELNKGLIWKEKVLASYRLMSWQFFSSGFFFSMACRLPERAFSILTSLLRRLDRLSERLERNPDHAKS